MALIPETQGYTRLVIGVLVSLVTLLALLLRHPYRNEEDHLVAVSSQCLLLVVFIGASYIKAYEDTDTLLRSLGQLEEGESFSRTIYGFSSSDQIVMFLLVFTFGLLVILLTTLSALIRQQGIMQTLRLKSTGKPPELTIRNGQVYHLFLSHSEHNAT